MSDKLGFRTVNPQFLTVLVGLKFEPILVVRAAIGTVFRPNIRPAITNAVYPQTYVGDARGIISAGPSDLGFD